MPRTGSRAAALLHPDTRPASPRAGRRPVARLTRCLGATLALVLAAALAAGCGDDDVASAGNLADRKIRVTATTNWHSDLARQIGGDRVQVTGLMGPGVDPHLYEASAGDVKTLSEADLAVWNALELEGKMDEVFAQVAKSVPVVAVGEAVPVVERIEIEDGPEFDPHVWFDPGNWKHAARAVAAALKELDPRHAAGYDARLRAFLAELDAVDRQVRALLAPIPKRSRVLVTSHDAFTYFADRYDFEVAAIQGKSTAGEATTADIERVAGKVAEAKLGAVFIESSVPRQTIEAVLAASAKRGQRTKVGGQLFGDALGSPRTPEGTYAGALLHNARVIARGLSR